MTILTHQRIDWLHQLANKSWILDRNPEFWHKVSMLTSDRVESMKFILEALKDSLYIHPPIAYNHNDEVEIWPMTLKNPVWLAAWFAKQSRWLKLWESFWFGFMTIWWITAEAQSWNLKPRIFRYSGIQSIINGMWLPWDWITNEVKRLALRKKLWLMPNVPLIANLCNSAITPEDQKIDEFKLLMEELYPYVDWFEINVSCPNQWWVCDMQQWPKLKKLLTELQEHNKLLAKRFGCERKALLVKIAPLSKNEYLNNWEPIKDLTLSWLELIANICNEVWIDWVTSTNTSQEHNLRNENWEWLIQKPDWTRITGWLSWLELHEQSLRTVKELRLRLDKTIPIIWVWWIWYDYEKAMQAYPWPISAVEMMKNWAAAVEILSSFVQWSIVVPAYLKYAIQRAKSRNDQTERFSRRF